MSGAFSRIGGGQGARIAFRGFLALLALFFADVLLGKARIALGWPVPFLLGDVGEFLLLLLTALLFAVAALLSEAREGGR